jgi:hypothetical protein
LTKQAGRSLALHEQEYDHAVDHEGHDPPIT